MMGRRNVKLLVTGPVNAGKSTLIRNLSDELVVCTNEQATDQTAEQKALTTVAMDHGICRLKNGIDLHLYGTPGQRRFDFMWEILAVGADAILVIVDGSDDASVHEARHIFDQIEGSKHLPFLFGISRQDHPAVADVAMLASRLGVRTDQITACDPRDGLQTRQMLTAWSQQFVRAYA